MTRKLATLADDDEEIRYTKSDRDDEEEEGAESIEEKLKFIYSWSVSESPHSDVRK